MRDDTQLIYFPLLFLLFTLEATAVAALVALLTKRYTAATVVASCKEHRHAAREV